MSENEEILREEFEKLKLELIASYDAHNLRASGKWEQELEIETTSHSATLWGADYTMQMKFGVPKGARPPLKAIEEWIYHKGIRPLEAKMSVSSLAFLIARKIEMEGSKVFRERKEVKFIEEVITPERIQKIIDKVSAVHISQAITELTQMTREIFERIN